MKQVKKYIIQKINNILKHTELYAASDNLKRRLDRTVQLQYLITPDILPFSKKATQIFKTINFDKIHTDTNLDISKNDLMFLFWLHQTSSIEHALTGYFKSGLTQVNTVNELLDKHFADSKKINILDFASGHGRVSRYFKNIFPANQITVADIKDNAVSFQKDIFGYKGFTVPSNPLDMNYKDHFDFILVSSLFTHLNIDLFTKWITALGELLNKNGVLAISLHLLNTNSDDFRYTEKSEDDLFPETSESLRGKNIYGLTYISRKSFTEILENNLGFKYEIIDEHDWAGSQVLFCIRRIA